MGALPGWGAENFKNAQKAWAFSCEHLLSLPPDFSLGVAGVAGEWFKVCEHFLQEDFRTPEAFRQYLKKYFSVYQVLDPQNRPPLFTGYFEPELKGSFQKTSTYSIPLYKKPPELLVIEDLGVFRDACKGHRIAGALVEGELQPYFTRREIYERVLEGRGLELVWVSSLIDSYFMSVQGSGLIRFENGETLRLGYDGTNGYLYTSIREVLVREKKLAPDQGTMEDIYMWAEKHPEEVQSLFCQNQSYVFFKALEKVESPFGRMGHPLVPKRSMAVDPAYLSLGLPLWLSTENPSLQRFMAAHDVGGAIKGPIRGDVFWGTGHKAGQSAGSMKTGGDFFLFLPKTKKVKSVE